MRSTVISSTTRFKLISYGNGLAYALHKLATNESFLVQGDDAYHFEAEYKTLGAGRLPLTEEQVLGVLWNDYCAVAKPEPSDGGV